MHLRRNPLQPWLAALVLTIAAPGILFPVSFNAPRVFPAGNGPLGIAAGDFNGDGKPDLATANHYSSSVSILMNDGHGGFLPMVNYASGTGGPTQLAVGDFNGDGNLDLAVLM